MQPIKQCKQCHIEFSARTSFQKYCSYSCVWKDKKGKKHKKGEYVSHKKNCVLCHIEYESTDKKQKYCSIKCLREGRSRLKLLKCAECLIMFKGVGYKTYHAKFCSTECYKRYISTHRIGKDNPAYRNGLRMKSVKKSYIGGKHLRACSAYKKHFLTTVPYPFCELCGVNENGTPKFEVHHIYYASLWPQHPELHNFRNLIHICIKCHNDLHAGRSKAVFEWLEKERNLKELFKR